MRDDGIVLDATFAIDRDPPSLVYESAGGKTDVNARNRDYGKGLPIVLRRLGEVGAVLTEIRVDSTVTRRLGTEHQRVHLRRHRLPLQLSQVGDFDDLKRDISTAAREPGAREGSSRGGSSRRLRFMLGSDRSIGDDLERSVAGAGVAPEVAIIRDLIDVAAGRTSGSGQGWLLSQKIKQAVENQAMLLAIAHYSINWRVIDVHADHPYDLECSRDEEMLFVEVKGTTTAGLTVIVTPNEVTHARAVHPRTELFVVSGITIDDRGAEQPRARGGIVDVYRGWGTEDSRLKPLGYEYRPGPT